MRALFGPFGMDPFAVAPQMQPHRPPRRQVLIYADGLCVFSVFDVFHIQHWLVKVFKFSVYFVSQAGPLAPFGMMGMVSSCIYDLPQYLHTKVVLRVHYSVFTCCCII